MKNTRLIKENIRISLQSIKSHLLRTILTVLIIAFGIMALVGILTAIDAVENTLTENFAMMGSNTFNIQNRDMHALKIFSPRIFEVCLSHESPALLVKPI